MNNSAEGLQGGHSKSTFSQDSQVLTPPPPPRPACLPLLVFEQPFTLPSPKVRSFWLELPLSPSMSILMKFRKKKLIMSTSIFG